ncbi:unnamed protein product [Gongylonema pulchrum]|uniref:Uncharacterized protein n=1 Tax=Gongylonema pulchrum TaxID=637853 RepID=A0A3P6PIL4_9BILA|nr:unnamed protein product [Gongylonema pulchrum]
MEAEVATEIELSKELESEECDVSVVATSTEAASITVRLPKKPVEAKEKVSVPEKPKKLPEAEVASDIELSKELESEEIEVSVVATSSEAASITVRLPKKLVEAEEKVAVQLPKKPVAAEEEVTVRVPKKPVEAEEKVAVAEKPVVLVEKKPEAAEITSKIELSKDAEGEETGISAFVTLSDSASITLRLPKKRVAAEEGIAITERPKELVEKKKPEEAEVATEIGFSREAALDNSYVSVVAATLEVADIMVRLGKKPTGARGISEVEAITEEMQRAATKDSRLKGLGIETVDDVEVSFELCRNLLLEFAELSKPMFDSAMFQIRLADKGKKIKKKARKAKEPLIIEKLAAEEEAVEVDFDFEKKNVYQVTYSSALVGALESVSESFVVAKKGEEILKRVEAEESSLQDKIRKKGRKISPLLKTVISLVVEKPSEQDFVELEIILSNVERCTLSVRPVVMRKMKRTLEKPEVLVSAPTTVEELPVEGVFVTFEFTKQRTQKIGVGAVFNSEQPTEQIELVEEIVRPALREEAAQLLFMHRERASTSIAVFYEEKGKSCTDEAVECAFKKQEKQSAETQLPQKITVDVVSTMREPVQKATLELLTQPSRDVSDQWKFVIAEIEVEAGEELATTDGTVDILATFEEAELTTSEVTSDILDVDVSLEAMLEEEFIEATGPTFYTQFK